MDLVPLKLVTIVAEPVLVERLTAELKQHGASGYTVTEVTGEGSRHMRAGELPGQNLKIETIVSATVAERILGHVALMYFHHYAVIAYVTDTFVVRGDKYA